MSATVHDGVVGMDGPWVGYLIEPMASVLLVVSLLIGFTAVQNSRQVPEASTSSTVVSRWPHWC